MGLRYFLMLLAVVTLPRTSFSVPMCLQQLARKWAPLVYLDKHEIYRPSSVPFFFKHVMLESNPSLKLTVHNIPKCNSSCFLVTKEPLATGTSTLPFFTGQPLRKVPVYTVIKLAGLATVISYWFFSPYNLGKVVCTDRLDGDRCLGEKLLLGNHLGEWEHIDVKFVNEKPVSIHLFYHNLRHDFIYDGCNFVNSRGQPNIKFYRSHPIIFSARGSHGSWSSAGIHSYRTLPNGMELVDECSKGQRWYTWRKMVIGIYDPTGCYEFGSPIGFIRFKGRWGNEKRECKIIAGLEACVLVSGPLSPP